MAKKSDVPSSKSPWVIVSLGSNLGNSRQTLCEAMARLQKLSAAPILKSSLWQTKPVDCPPQSPKFVNAVIALLPERWETPASLLGKMQALEHEYGRSPGATANAPRPLDLDLIAFGDETCATPELKLPHPRAHKRRFVMQPLNEIMADLILPGQILTVSQLLRKLPDVDAVEWLSSPH